SAPGRSTVADRAVATRSSSSCAASASSWLWPVEQEVVVAPSSRTTEDTTAAVERTLMVAPGLTDRASAFAERVCSCTYGDRWGLCLLCPTRAAEVKNESCSRHIGVHPPGRVGNSFPRPEPTVDRGRRGAPVGSSTERFPPDEPPPQLSYTRSNSPHRTLCPDRPTGGVVPRWSREQCEPQCRTRRHTRHQRRPRSTPS